MDWAPNSQAYLRGRTTTAKLTNGLGPQQPGLQSGLSHSSLANGWTEPTNIQAYNRTGATTARLTDGLGPSIQAYNRGRATTARLTDGLSSLTAKLTFAVLARPIKAGVSGGQGHNSVYLYPLWNREAKNYRGINEW